MRIAMLLHKSVEHDARVRREARALHGAGHDLVVVHLPRAGSSVAGAAEDGYELRSATSPGASQRLPGPLRRGTAATRLSRLAAAERPDVVHAHDAAMLAPGWIAARRTRARLVYDSHELATEVPYRSPAWAALVASVERLFVPRSDAVITVSDGIAERLQQKYSLPERPAVVRNVPDLPPPAGGTAGDGLRARLGANEAPLIVHHGAVAGDRGCENLIRALPHLDRAHLLFLGAEGGYVDGLRKLAAELGLEGRVHFHPPVSLDELLSYSAQADLGVTLLEATCDNHRLALPNKAFEYVAAGIPVIASDLPELRALIESYGIGWTVDPSDPPAIAAAIERGLGARGDRSLRDRLSRAAAELTWEREQERLLGLYARLDPER